MCMSKSALKECSIHPVSSIYTSINGWLAQSVVVDHRHHLLTQAVRAVRTRRLQLCGGSKNGKCDGYMSSIGVARSRYIGS